MRITCRRRRMTKLQWHCWKRPRLLWRSSTKSKASRFLSRSSRNSPDPKMMRLMRPCLARATTKTLPRQSCHCLPTSSRISPMSFPMRRRMRRTRRQIIAKRNDDKVEENTDMKENNIDRDDELKYQAKITPDCDWIIKNFDGRAEARAAEMNGLTTAKEFLAGRTALLQSKSKFDDTSFAKINF